MITILQIDPIVLKQNKLTKASTYVEAFSLFLTQFCAVIKSLVHYMFYNKKPVIIIN